MTNIIRIANGKRKNMEKAITEQYNQTIFSEIISKYGLEPDKVKLLDGFESYIYECCRDGVECILRISHTRLRRTKEQLLAEMDYINYMADNGVPAARSLPSPQGNLIETAESNPLFAGALFDKAKGHPPKREFWQPLFIQNYGEIVGRMHRLTKSYKAPTNCRRPEGMEDLEGFAEKFLPPEEKEIIREWNTMLDYLRTLPKGVDEYGLIHQDLHGGNFFVDDAGDMTLFDFDDCQYFWFSHDIAMCLFYVVPHHCEKQEDLDNARMFLKEFMTGYQRENQLDPKWVLEIPTFLRLREMDLYVAIHRSMDLDDLGPWCASFMKNRKEKILNGFPYVGIDYHTIL